MSRGESRIQKFLKKNKIAFVPQKTFSDCKHLKVLPFDFYLPKYNLLIEFQGAQHYRPVEVFGGKEAFIGQKHRDKIKKEFAKKNDIVLLAISYKKLNRIPSILKRKLKL